ncbi:MAG: dihydrofolate reductase [Nanoarchaeota archaeon]
MRKITLIAAVSDNGVIGYNDSIPWDKIPEDMRHFRQLTIGNPVVMGRKTYDSLNGNPLSDRTNIVLSSGLDKQTSGIFVARNLDEALKIAISSPSRDENCYVIGGSRVYSAFLPIASNIELTRVRTLCQGNAFFPLFNAEEWTLAKKDVREGYDFESYERK